MRDLSVVMPALNEEMNIRKAAEDVLKGFDEFKIDGELVLVNDGSSDGTSAIMKEIGSMNPKRVSILEHESPGGIGASFRDGVAAACKDSVVMLPGDAENDPGEIFKYISLMDHVDIIVPYVVNRDVRAPFRNFISKIFLALINISFGLSLNYTNGTVVYRKSMLEGIERSEPGFFYQVETLVKSIKKGFLYAEVPYRLSKRASGGSKALTAKSFREVLAAYFRLLIEIYFRPVQKSRGVKK